MANGHAFLGPVPTLGSVGKPGRRSSGWSGGSARGLPALPSIVERLRLGGADEPGEAGFQGSEEFTVLLPRLVMLYGELAANNRQAGSDAGSQNSYFLRGHEDADGAGKASHQGPGDGSPEDDRRVGHELRDHLNYFSFARVTHRSITLILIGTGTLEQSQRQDVPCWGSMCRAPEVSP